MLVPVVAGHRFSHEDNENVNVGELIANPDHEANASPPPIASSSKTSHSSRDRRAMPSSSASVSHHRATVNKSGTAVSGTSNLATISLVRSRGKAAVEDNDDDEEQAPDAWDRFASREQHADQQRPATRACT